MNDFSVVRQGIKGGPPFSVNGRAVETLADEALDRIKAELIRLRNYHQDPVEVARLRERIKELETFRNGENNEWWMAEVTRLREEIAERQVNLDGWADRAEEAEAELARLHEDKRKLQDYWKEEQDHRIEAEDERDRLREELEDLQLMLDDCEARNALSIEGEAGR